MTQLLDHKGSPIKKESGRDSLRQTVSRRIRARYDAAQTVRDNERHWAESDSLSAAAANAPDIRRVLRNRARYEVANNSYAAGMVRTLACDVIGTGPQLQMQSGDNDTDTQIETEFWKWSQAVGLGQKLAIMRIARTVDGESFALLTTNGMLRNPVKLDLKLYEADQVARPWVSLTDPNMSDGIIYDDFGNPLAYTLLKQHPGDLGTFINFVGDYDTIPARNMIHYYRPERPGQQRGIPEIMPALPLYSQLRRYTLAVIAAAETAADLAILLHTQAAPEDPDDLEPLDLFDLERRSAMTLPKGWTPFQMKAEQPATTYGMFKREIINEIARCLGMPYNIAAGDSSGYNYASGRLDHQTYFKSIRVDRIFTDSVCLERIFLAWWDEARRVENVLLPQFRDVREPPSHEWRWDGHEHVDPKKEADAATTLISEGLMSEADYQAKNGRDWEDQQRQVAKELGITVVELRKRKLEKRYPSAPATQPATPDDEDDDEDDDDTEDEDSQ
jgi:lambda family phage portal protein